MLDRVGFGDRLLVVALGITDDGTKVPLGLVKAPPRRGRSAPGWCPTSPTAAWTPSTADNYYIVVSNWPWGS